MKLSFLKLSGLFFSVFFLMQVSGAEDLHSGSVTEAVAHASHEQARHYLDLRNDLAQLRTAKPAPSQSPQQLDKLIEQLLPKLSKSPSWNASHPNWKKAKGLLTQAFTQMNDSVRQNQINQRQFDDVFIKSFGEALSENELAGILTFYESSTGKSFVETHVKLFAAYPKSAAILGEKVSQGIRPNNDPPANPSQLIELVGLFNELMELAWISNDPGPSGDRSGLAAIPISTAMAIRLDFDRLENIWLEMPEQSRKDALEYRSSALGQKEKAALRAGLEAETKFARQYMSGQDGQAFMKAMTDVQKLVPQ